MNELLKRGFLVGLGAAVVSKEKLEKYFQELVAKGKLTQNEAEDLYDSFLKKGEEAGERWNRRSKERIHNLLTDFDLVSKKEFDGLKERIEKLEQHLDAIRKEI